MDLRDRVVCETLYTRGIWEENITRVLGKLITPGMVVVDLGANVGYYTLLAAERVGKAGRVFAFEPDPFCYGLLEKNIAINPHTNVTPVNKAVADRTGTVQFLLEGKNKGGHRLAGSWDDRNTIGVEVTSLDDFFKNRESPIHLIKMDIQGAEMAALRGMRKVIENNNNLAIVVEFWPGGMERLGDSAADFLRMLLEYGFRLSAIRDSEIGIESIDVTSLLGCLEGETHLFCEKGELSAKLRERVH